MFADLQMKLPGNPFPAVSHGSAPPHPTRLLSLDFLRVLACLAVMAGHVSSAFIYKESCLTLWGMNLAFVINQCARFSVPLFLLLSGFTLGMGGPVTSYGSFLRKRCRKVLLPYGAWVLVYGLYNASFDLGVWFSQFTDPGYLLAELLTGRGAPHLYFIPLLFQFYLVYPLLKKWADRNPLACFLWTLTISFLIQGLHSLDGLNLIPFSLPPWLLKSAVGWCFFFVAGMCLQKVDLTRLILRGSPAPLTIFSLLFALLYSAWSFHTGLLDSMKPELMLYTPLVFLWGISIWPCIQYRQTIVMISFLSKHSLSIYFNHVLILCSLRYVPRFSLGMSGMGMLFLGTLLCAVLLAVVLDFIFKKIKSIR